MTAAWDHLWTTFGALVETLNEAVRPEERGFVVRVDRHANDVFPFRALVSYSPTSSPGDEALVLSVDFKRVGHMVHGHVDLARGEGFILVDEQIAPAFEEDQAAVRRALSAAETRLERFVAANRDLFDQELRRTK